MLGFDNKILRYNHKWLDGVVWPDYHVYTSVSGYGKATCTATPNHGIYGTEVTLSTTDIEEGYELGGYTVEGAFLKNSNQFDIAGSDAYVTANIVAINPTKTKYIIVQFLAGVDDPVPNRGMNPYTPYNPSSAPITISNMRIRYNGTRYPLTPIESTRNYYANYPIYGGTQVRTPLSVADITKSLYGNEGLTLSPAHEVVMCFKIPDELNHSWPNSSDCPSVRFDVERSGSLDYYGNMPSYVENRQRKLNNLVVSLYGVYYDESLGNVTVYPNFDYPRWDEDPRYIKPWYLIRYRGDSYQPSYSDYGVALYGLSD